MRIKPFPAWRPAPGEETHIASPPYDVVDRASALALAGPNPKSFLHITRAEIDLPTEIVPPDPRVYAASAEAFRHFKAECWLRQDQEPSLYAYRLSTATHEQTGLVTVLHADDYENGLIRKHEFTRPGPEEDRTRHMQALNAQPGPLLLAFRGDPAVEALLDQATRTDPLFDVEAEDGIRHTGWRLPDVEAMANAFSTVPAVYIADGHHRAAGAARVARERRESAADSAGEQESDWMLGVIFPAAQLEILAYNRCVRDLAPLTPDRFLDRIQADFFVDPNANPRPTERGRISMYRDGRWYGLVPRTPPDESANRVQTLDVSILQDRILAPILGITDPRRDERLSFIGGYDTLPTLIERVDGGAAAAAFSLHPVSMDELMAVSDAGLTLPPKSTWFEPKLRSGLFVHGLQALSGGNMERRQGAIQRGRDSS